MTRTAKRFGFGTMMGMLAGTVLTVAASGQDVALGGNDPTSYFGARGPVAGSADVELERGGRTYRFASDASKRAFEAAAERFEPVFGGHDPVALARGEQVLGDPGVYSVVGERVFVFSDDASRIEFLKSPGSVVGRAAAAFESVAGTDETGRLGLIKSRRTREHNLKKNKLAVQGYDVVGYFPEGGGRPQKGKANLSVNFDGATYRFASARHRDRFLENPTRYEPAHGGWCSYAASQGSYAEVDPKKFRIEEGRLLLFYNGVFNDTKKKWEKSKKSLLPAADEFWLEETGEAARHG